ncbi:unnamed protein product [Sympodiomycopsis kandeliae]
MTPSLTLRRLNGDTSWLLSCSSSSNTYTILIDPWLSPSSQIDYHPRFSSQTRGIPALYTSVSDVLEGLAQSHLSTDSDQAKTSQTKQRVNAILLSHPFTDHTHPQSLLEYLDCDTEDDSTIDVFCTPDSYSAFQKLLNKTDKEQKRYKLYTLPSAPWQDDIPIRSDTLPSLPSQLSIFHLPARESPWSHGPAWKDLHSAIAILHHRSDSDTYSSIVYSPHGTLPSSIPPFLSSSKVTGSRTLLTSWDHQVVPGIRLFTGPVSLGIQQAVLPHIRGHLKPTITARTHDEHKIANGLIGMIIKRNAIEGEEQARRVIETETAAEYNGRVIHAEVGQVIQLD